MNWKIPLFKIHWDEEDVESVTETIEKGICWAVGPNVEKFEEKIAEYIGTKYAAIFNSGTSALHATFLSCGIKKDDEVIVPSFTFIATANAPLFVGAKPVFADIEERIFGLDPEDVKDRITPKSRAIIPIHYGGCPCLIRELKEIAEDHHLILFEDAAEYIKTHREINNVLISGGDPLVLSNKVIERFLEILTEIKHLCFIRLGSRTPITLPSRLSDSELLTLFKKYSQIDKRLYVVTQFNHPREITSQSVNAVSNLIKAGVLLSNQTVLLRGVNDDPDTLAMLMNRLVSIGVTPYYVFQCRPVKRVKSHFQVPICEGARIVEKAKANCNGHSKRFKYAMSHKTGKIEILGIMNGEIFFKYHQAKDRKNLGVMFKRRVDDKAGWLDDFSTNVGTA